MHTKCKTQTQNIVHNDYLLMILTRTICHNRQGTGYIISVGISKKRSVCCLRLHVTENSVIHSLNKWSVNLDIFSVNNPIQCLKQ